MTIEEKIERAIMARVALLDLDVEIDVPRAEQNISFPARGQPKPTTYIEVRYFRNANRRLFLKGSDAHHRQGFLQLTVISPLNQGYRDATDLGGQIAEHFPADLALFEEGVKVRIQKAPDVLSADKTDTAWEVPVAIYYEAFA